MNFLWIDAETTGLDSNHQDIVQLACIAEIDGVEQPQVFNEFCQPTRYDNIDQKALDTHGITIAQMRTFQTQAEMLDKLIAFVQQFNMKFAIAGYNVGFDKSFVGATFSKHNKSHEFLKLFTLDVHCTYKRAQEVKKDLIRTPNLKLNTLATAYGIPIDAHDALSDIRATIKLDVIVASLLGENTTLIEVDTTEIPVDREFKQPAQLHLHSTYNMIDSLPSVDEWAQWCKDTGTPGFSIVDHGNAISMFDILRVKEKYGVEGVPGVGLNFIFPDQKPEDFSSINAWAITEEGYFNLMKLSSLGYTRAFTQAKTALTIPILTVEEIKRYQNGIIFGTGDAKNIMGRELLAENDDAALARLDQYHDVFQILYYEFAPTDVHYVYDHKIGFRKLRTNLGKLYNQWLFKQATARDQLHECFPVSGAHFINPKDKIVQDCVSKNSAKGRYYYESYHALDAKQIYIGLKRHLGETFNEDLFEKWISATYRLLNGARTHIDIKYDYHLPQFQIPENIVKHIDDYQMQTYHLMMQKIKQHGRWRDDEQYVARFKKEVKVIMKNPTLNFIPYFLLYEDICAYARSAGFLQNIARGSAGGSLISYYLKIIHVDPIEKDLPFERFLSNARIRAGSFPDIDADFGDKARPSIIKYLQEKYGLGFAQVSTLSRMKTKNAIKDVVWALYGRNRNDPEIKAVCDTIPDSPQGVDEKDFLYGYTDKEGQKHEGIVDLSPTLVNFFKSYPDVERMVKKLLGTIRGWSRHASAFVISTVDLAHTRVPTMTMSDKELGRVTVTQYEASMVEKCGLVKADILGIKTLTAVTECLSLVKQRTGKDFLEEDNRGIQLLYRLPEDEAVYADFYNKKTDSSFQFNTNLIKGYLQDFIPTTRKQLADMTALCRPGALDAPFEDTTAAKFYMDVRGGKRTVKYLHPDLEPILKDSNGVFVYQEEIMRFLVEIVGYTWEESDIIRNAIAKKKHKVMMAAFDKIREGTKKRGWTEEQTETVCKQVQAFSKYSFNKSHSYAYAELGYITMYLKHYYPLEWWTAILNLHLDSEDKMRKDIVLLGDLVSPPSLENPSMRFVIGQDNKHIIAPISAIKGIGPMAVKDITSKGPFANLQDFIDRVDHRRVTIGTFATLVKARATDCFMQDDGFDYPTARQQLLTNYLILRRKQLKTFRSEFKQEMFLTDPITIFLMERDCNLCFNKALLKDRKIVDVITGMWPGLIRKEVKDIPFLMGNIPVLGGIDVATKLLQKDFDKDVGLILLFKSSSAKSGISKRTGKPYTMLKIQLSDGYHDLECVKWDANQALSWKKDSLVYVRGQLKEGWRTAVSMTLKEFEKVEKI